MRILIVEDNPSLADWLGHALRQSDYAVDAVRTGAEADHILLTQYYDLVILDLTLPQMDGFEVLRRLRGRKCRVPVLILTARDGLEERVRGLNLGADDYLGKPFDLAELEARARALIRRGQCGDNPRLSHGALSLDTVGRIAELNGALLELPPRELCVLESLMRRAGKVVSKEHLFEQVFSLGEDAGINAIEIYIHRLRKKLAPAGVGIRTIRGLGYLLEKSNG